MVELARALSTRPVLLLLDEIAAGLTEAEIAWLLEENKLGVEYNAFYRRGRRYTVCI